jgi:putative hydrolase of the HAD superfamily
MSMIDRVLWDLGGVLCHFHPERRTAAFAQLSGQPLARVDEVISEQLRADLDLGNISPAELLERVSEGLDWDCDHPTLARAWCAAFIPDAEVVAIARDLTAGCGLLTNNGPPIADAFELCLPEVAAVISAPVFSSDIGVTKPNRRAFDAACKVLDAEPARVLFIDDNPTNVSAARSAGLVAVNYTNARQLRRHLRDMDVNGAAASEV